VGHLRCPVDSLQLNFPLAQTSSYATVEDPVEKIANIIVCKKQTVDSAAPRSDAPVDSAVAVYPIHIDCEEQW